MGLGGCAAPSIRVVGGLGFGFDVGWWKVLCRQLWWIVLQLLPAMVVEFGGSGH